MINTVYAMMSYLVLYSTQFPVIAMLQALVHDTRY
jgi:hypothetical protein